MKRWAHSAVVATLMVAATAPQLVTPAKAEDLKDAIPSDVFLAVYGKHNPERDYQKKYHAEIYEAVEKSRIIERVVQLIQSRASEDNVQQMLAFRDTIKEAVAPVQWDKLSDLQEVVYGQKMEGPVTQNILIMRFPEGGAASLVEGIGNLMNLADQAAGDGVTVVAEEIEGASVRILQLPQEVPISPVVGHRGDLFIYSSNPQMAAQCLQMLDNPSLESKFDDPRLAEALQHLPESEDALSFFDGQALGDQLQGVVGFIQTVAAGNDEALRIAGLINSLINEVMIFDYEIGVEFTDGYRNRSAAFRKLNSKYKNTVAGRMLADQEPFSDWASWVPANASGFSLDSGANLHPIYEWVTTNIPEVFPESEEIFEKFDAVQTEYDIFLDADILQGFGGESISISLPGPPTPMGASTKSVSLMSCNKPERLEALITRGLDALLQIPDVKAQGVTVTDSPTLEGYKQFNAAFFMLMGGLSPVFGFDDGWLVAGTHADAVQQVMLTKGGEAENFAATDKFTQFGIEVDGDVTSISYTNTGEQIRQAAAAMQQIGGMLPMILAMSGQQGGADLEPVKDVLALLPSVGRIVQKFDFIESTLSVTQPGPEDGTWIRHSVTMIRPPADESAPE